jgi:phosphonate transport system substrate-binding protein
MLLRILVILVLMFCPVVSSAQDYKLAVYPSNDPKKLIVPMTIMAEYLSEKSGHGFKAIVTRDYAELSERLWNRSVDIAWINPINYIKIKSEMPEINYIATYMEQNDETGEIIPYYQSFIVTLKDSGLVSLEKGKNTLFAFTDLGSTSGYAYPKMMLNRLGIEPNSYFKKVFFLKKHDRVMEALVNKSIDAGAVSDGTYYTAVRKYGDIFNILLKSDQIPLDAIVAPPHVQARDIMKYREILISMPLDHPFNQSMRENLGWNAAGFEVRDDDFYNSMREALKY